MWLVAWSLAMLSMKPRSIWLIVHALETYIGLSTGLECGEPAELYIHSWTKPLIEALEAAEERRRESAENKRHVFIDALIEQTNDPRVLRDQCLSLLLLGGIPQRRV
jgi:hypothetical protein